MKFRFRAAEEFWRAFYALSPVQKDSVRRAWAIFKANPFDPRLGTHKIHRLSARYRTNVYSVVIEADLRAVFMMQGDTITTLDLGTHDIYR
jgi:mRNA-degrading endonuclease YafQ of YafQ-DinJ toxin-antitoxin module